MIKRTKRPLPNVLSIYGTSWTKQLMTYVNAGQTIPVHVQGHYRHAEIKSEVKHETEEKCIYCESLITHQYPGDVEHIIPKSVYPRLTFTWNNLSFVCFWCNNNKKATLDKNCKLLNPYKDEVGDHLQAFGPMVFHINDSKRGELTWKMINLNRKELIERRADSLKEIQNLIDKYNRENVHGLKMILLNEIIENARTDKEFSMYKKQFLKDKGLI